MDFVTVAVRNVQNVNSGQFLADSHFRLEEKFGPNLFGPSGINILDVKIERNADRVIQVSYKLTGTAIPLVNAAADVFLASQLNG